MVRSLSLLVIVTLLLTACETVPWFQKSTQPTAELEPSDEVPGSPAPPLPEPGLALTMEQRFSDVPLPVGLKEDLSQSYIYESAELQIGRMVYTTRASVNELVQFYIRECPAGEWKLKNTIQAAGAELLFEKPGKRLIVSIRGQGVGRRRLLILNLMPEPTL